MDYPDTHLTRVESQLMRLREAFDEERGAQRDRWAKIEPIVLARSGELERIRTFERDLNHLGAKHRESSEDVKKLDARIEALESWKAQLKAWIAGGIATGVALGQLLLWVLQQVGVVK